MQSVNITTIKLVNISRLLNKTTIKDSVGRTVYVLSELDPDCRRWLEWLQRIKSIDQTNLCFLFIGSCILRDYRVLENRLYITIGYVSNDGILLRRDSPSTSGTVEDQKGPRYVPTPVMQKPGEVELLVWRLTEARNFWPILRRVSVYSTEQIPYYLCFNKQLVSDTIVYVRSRRIE